MSLRPNQLETLFTANVEQLEKADKRVKEIAQRVESNPIEQKITADPAAAVAGMARVEEAAAAIGKTVDRVTDQQVAAGNKTAAANRAVTKQFLDSHAARKMSEQELAKFLERSHGGRSAEQAAELARVAKRLHEVRDEAQQLSTKGITPKVDTREAIAGMDRVEAKAKALVSADTAMSLNIEVANAERAFARAEQRFELLKVKAAAGIDVKAQLGRAEADVSKFGRTLEKLREARTTIEVQAPVDDAIAGMDRVEARAKRIVSAAVIQRVEVETGKAEQNLEKIEAELEVLRSRTVTPQVSADIAYAERRLATARTRLDDLNDARAIMQVEANDKPAIEAIGRVRNSRKVLVSEETAIEVNAKVAEAEQRLSDLRNDLSVLHKLKTTPEVKADIAEARANIRQAKSELSDLRGERATMVVDVSADGAKAELRSVASTAADAGAEGGEQAGSNLSAGIVAALATIPIAGAVVGVGVAAGKALFEALQDGLQQDVGRDRLGALTGIDEATALRFGRAAGEAYANTFGESVEANMNTSRLALQFRILDPQASNRDAQSVISGLAGISDVLEEDVQVVARTTAQLLRTGLAGSAKEAFDIFAAGARNGVNVSDDLLDTLWEYSTSFKQLGLTGGQALGLMNQGLKAGAPNTDFFADSLRELRIRIQENTDETAGFVSELGLVPSDLRRAFSEGGPAAAEGLDKLFDALRNTEDANTRNRIAVGLLGTQYEDLQFDLNQIDVSSAVDQLGQIDGAAKAMFDRLADNDATKLEQAQRNIEIASDGIKGALASAFSEPLGELADFVSQNRGPVMQFMLDLANGALDFGVAMVNSTADATISLGEFVAGPLADAAEGLASLIEWLPGDQNTDELKDLADEMRGFDTATKEAADTMRQRLIEEGLEPARDRLNEFGNGAVAMGFLNDASLRLAESLGQLGYDAQGAAISMDGVDGSNLRASESGLLLEEQVRNTIAALGEEINAAGATGESQDELKARYDSTTEALVGQLTQMGLTQEQARALIEQVLQTPGSVSTHFGSNADAQRDGVQRLNDRIVTLEDGSVVVLADTSLASTAIDSFISRYTGNTISLRVDGTPVINGKPQVGRAGGGKVQGAGTETSDSIDARLSHNEHVWTAAETRGAGGHERVEVLRAYAKAGRLGELLPGFRNGGPVLERYIGAQPAAVARAVPLAVAPSGAADPLAALAAVIVSALGGSSSTASAGAPLLGSLTLQSTGDQSQDLRNVTRELRVLDLGGRKPRGR